MKGGSIMAGQTHIKASLVDDKGTWTVRARFAERIGESPKLHSKSTGFKVKGNNKRKAEARMREIVSEWEQCVDSAQSSDNPKFSDRIALWLDNKQLSIRANTLASYRDIAKIHIIPSLGDVGICDLTRQMLQRYFEKLRQDGLSVSSMKKHRVIIRGVLRDAVLDDIITANVADNISLKQGKKYEGKAISESQVAELLERSSSQPEPVRAAVTLALVYGLRRSEICGLRWEDVDFENHQIHIRNTVREYNGNYYEDELTKTKASRRDLCFVPGTDVYLSELQQTQKTSGAYTGKVCAHPDGRFLRPEFVSRSSKRFMKSCGIEGFRLHDLRHTAATILAKRVPIKQVQAFLGHQEIQTTLNIYTHISGEDRLATANAMGDFLNESGFPCSESCSETGVHAPDNVIHFPSKVWNNTAKGS